MLRSEALFHLDRAEEAQEVLQEAAREGRTLVDSGSISAGIFLPGFYARLERKEDAIRAAQRQIELVADDLYEGPKAEEFLAYAYTNLGDPEAAIEIYDRLLATSYYDAVTIEELRFHPLLDPIRDDPRFQTMLEKHEKKTD